MIRIKNIKDLAEMAGVSAGTVSRALAGSELISVKTRERVQALADEYGFRPNVMARNLRNQRTGAIGVLIPLGHEAVQHLPDPFFMTMLELLADVLGDRGYDLVLSRGIPADGQWLERSIESGRVDGLIVIGQSDQADALDRVAARYKPLVVWGGHFEGQVHCSVGSDNRRGGDLAASHLLDRGCRRIAFIGDCDGFETSQQLEGCCDALRRVGQEDRLHVVPPHLVAEVAYPDFARLLDPTGERPLGPSRPPTSWR
jgi:DNA-binding LacI/PurR family transcriptional regulator